MKLKLILDRAERCHTSMHCELLLDCHARVIMAEAWKKLNDKVRAKRTKKDNPKDRRRPPKGEELTVQRIRPREFVPQPMLFQQILDV